MIRDADQVLALDRGEIVERGTHDELLALARHYARLVTRDTSLGPTLTACPTQRSRASPQRRRPWRGPLNYSLDFVPPRRSDGFRMSTLC